MIQGYSPGPTLFTDSGSFIYGIFAALIIANIFLLILGLGASSLFPQLLKIPENILMPTIVVLCVLGSYAVSNSPFDVLIMLIFGILGYVMLKVGLPLAPMLLAIILAPIVETNFRRSMIISENDYSIFFTRPITLVVLIITLLVFVGIIRSQLLKSRMIGASK